MEKMFCISWTMKEKTFKRLPLRCKQFLPPYAYFLLFSSIFIVVYYCQIFLLPSEYGAVVADKVNAKKGGEKSLLKKNLDIKFVGH